MKRIFISYNRKDEDFVSDIVTRLKAIGFNAAGQLFYDRDSLAPGQNWPKEIEKALDESDCVLVFIGGNNLGAWQDKEVLKAANKGVRTENPCKIIPIIVPGLDDRLQKDVPWIIAEYQWIEFKSREDAVALEYLRDSILDMRPAGLEEALVVDNPYKGLEYFNVQDAPLFFGRTFDLNWVLYKRLRLHTRSGGSRFLAIVGDSGSGKSSFARAGILAALKAEKYRGVSAWEVITMEPGKTPLLNLSTSLENHHIIRNSLKFDQEAIQDSTHFLRTLKADREHVLNGKGVVLLIDQFEEVVTQCDNKDIQKAFLNNLVDALDTDKLLLLITLRSDYYASFTGYPRFVELLEKNNYTLSSLDPGDDTGDKEDWERQMLRIIRQPARLAGCHIPVELAQKIAADVKGIHGVLPVLEMALSELWKKKDRAQEITDAHYRALSQDKGIPGIIEQHADEALVKFRNEGNKEELARLIFLKLVQITENKEDVRKTPKKESLIRDLMPRFTRQEVEHALEFLSGPKARLLRIKSDKNINADSDDKPEAPGYDKAGRQDWVEVTHEVLIRKWGTFRNWLDKKREALKLEARIKEDILDWTNNQCGYDYLYSEGKLRRAVEWLAANEDLKTPEIEDFIFWSGKKEALLYKDEITGHAQHWAATGDNRALYASAQLEEAEQWLSEHGKWLEEHAGFQPIEIKAFMDQSRRKDDLLYGETIARAAAKYDTGKLPKDLLNQADTVKAGQWLGKNPDLSTDGIKTFIETSRSRLTKKRLLQWAGGITAAMLAVLLSIQGINWYILKRDFKESRLGKYYERRNKPLSEVHLVKVESSGELKFLSLFDNLDSLIIESSNPNEEFDWSKLSQGLNLKYLSVSYSPGIRNFNTLPKLDRLAYLELKYLDNVDSITGLKRIGKLDTLYIEDLPSLTSLQELEGFENLYNLRLSSLDNLSSISVNGLIGLKSLDLSYLPVLASLQGLEGFPNLQYLSLSGFDTLSSISINGRNNLKSLRLTDLRALTSIQGLEGLQNLEYLSLYGADSIRNISINGLDSLKSLRLESLRALDSFNGQGFQNLRYLSLIDMDSLKSITIKGLKKLDSLELSNLPALTSLHGLEGLQNLKYLSLHYLKNLRNISVIGLNGLNSLDLSYLPALTSLQDLEGLNNLHYLSLSGFDTLSSISINGLDSLKYLRLMSLRALASLDGLQSFQNLRYLSLYSLQSLKSISIKGLKKLDSLNLTHLPALTSLQGLEGLQNLQYLRLQSLKNIRSISVNGLNGLKSLDLSYLPALTSLQDLEGFPNLQYLSLSGFDTLSSISINGRNNLKSLRLESLRALTSIDGQGFQNLRYLNLSGLPSLESISIKGLNKLDSLALFKLSALTSLQGLEGLQELQYLSLSDLDSLTSITIKGLKKLDSLKLSTLPALTSLHGLEGLQSLNYLVLYDLEKIKANELSPLKQLSGSLKLVYVNIDVHDNELRPIRTALPSCEFVYPEDTYTLK